MTVVRIAKISYKSIDFFLIYRSNL